MGQAASVFRVSQETFEKIQETKEFPKRESIKEEIDVDKLWEPIMYLFGKGFIGREPTVYLFLPKNMIVTYEDEYMKNGIKYHTREDMINLYDYMKKEPVDKLIEELDIERLNSKVMYSIIEDDIAILRDLMNKVIEFFERGIDEKDVIIASIG
jgi:hypothetical protein